MIASVIGRTFLNAFNEKYNLSLSAKAFFDDRYFKLFFDHPKYMQWVTNSPFVQMKSGQKAHLLSSDERKEKLTNLHDKVLSGNPEASIAIGFPASEESEFATTSGLVSDVAIPCDEEEIYLSWIGSGLGLGVAGGYSIFFDQAEILLATFDGWYIYRKYLNNPVLKGLRGNQINSWNGQWLSFVFDSNRYKEDFDFSFLEQLKFFKSDSEKIEVDTVPWSRLFFSISQKFPDRTFTGYVYSLGQTNKTIGFIPFQFQSGDLLKTIYRKLFAPERRINVSDFEALFGMHIKRACELGSIGLQALRPEKLRSYFTNASTLSFNKEEDTILYHVFKTWLIAMLSKNKKEMTDYTERIASALLRYKNEGSKNDRKNLIEKAIFPAKGKVSFLDALVQIIKDVGEEELPLFKQLRDEVHLMTNEEYTYFVTLIKFDYALQERNSKD